MVCIHFSPADDIKETIEATHEYTKIWESEGSSILESLHKFSGLELEEDEIEVIVYEGISYSGRNITDPMRLRASYINDVKKATLIHELGHRLLFNHETESSEDEHKLLNLFLFDVWQHLYGVDFANRMVEVESDRDEMYKTAWKFALSKSKEQRQKLLNDRLGSTPN